MTAPAGKFEFRIELPVRNEWDDIEKIRASMMECFTTVFRDVENSIAIANIAGELMENAVKFGNWSEGHTHFMLRIWGDGAVAHIEVQSPVDPEAPEISELLDLVAWLRAADNAADAYRRRLIDDSRGPRGMSKLGLARVAYEGDCALAAEIVDGSVKVLAITRLRT
jgi:hypothetical protein